MIPLMPGTDRNDREIQRNSRGLTQQQQFARPIIQVEVSTGRIVVDGIRDFWNREVVKTLDRSTERQWG